MAMKPLLLKKGNQRFIAMMGRNNLLTIATGA